MTEFNRRQLFHHGLGGLAIAGASTLTLQADAAPTARTLDVHNYQDFLDKNGICLLYTSPSPRDATLSRMPSSA